MQLASATFLGDTLSRGLNCVHIIAKYWDIAGKYQLVFSNTGLLGFTGFYPLFKFVLESLNNGLTACTSNAPPRRRTC